MSRKQSETTQLRRLKSDYARLRRNYTTLTDESARNLTRALAAEKSLQEWKDRFDALLKVTENKP